MSGELSVEIFQADGITQALLLHHPQVSGLRYSSQIPGGFRDCSFFWTRSLAGWFEHSDLQFNNKVKILSSAGTAVWEGRIEDVEYIKEEGQEGMAVQCLGPYSSMLDQVYNRVWVDPRQERWWYPDTTNSNANYNAKHRSDMYRNYTTEKGLAVSATPVEVLGIEAIEGKIYKLDTTPVNNGWYAMWKYQMPSGETVKRITFDYKTNFPIGSWRMGVFGETAPDIEGTPITATGSGSEDITLATPSQVVWIFMQALAVNDLSRGISALHTNGGITYTGANWSTDASYPSLYKTASIRVNANTNATDKLEYTFTGKGIQLFGSYRANAGIIEVYLKRGAGAYSLEATVDMYEVEPGGDNSQGQYSRTFFERHNLDWDTYTVKVQMTNTTSAPSGEKGFFFDYLTIDSAIFAQASNVVIYGATGAVYADTVIKDALTSKCPDIDSDQSGIGSPALALSYACFESDARPAEIVEDLAILGDGSSIWDFVIWNDWIPEFAIRPTAVTHWVQLDDVEITLKRSIQAMWNQVYATYSDAKGSLTRTTPTEDADSQAKHSLMREYALPAARAGATIAGQLATVALALYKDPSSSGQIRMGGGLRNTDNLGIPIEEFRAGSILRVSGLLPHEDIAGTVNDKGVFFCKAVEFDADSWSLTVTPGDPLENLEIALQRLGGVG